MKRPSLLKTLETKALCLLLSPLRVAHGFTGRMFLKTQALARSRLRPVSTEARWKHLMAPLPVELPYGYASRPGGYAVCEISPQPFIARGDIADYEWYRRVMDTLGSPVPDVEPPRELSPVADSVLGCRFDFERPDIFAGMRKLDRTQLDIEF